MTSRHPPADVAAAHRGEPAARRRDGRPPRHRVMLLACALITVILLGYAVGLRWIGERWWPTTLQQYLPHIGLLVPIGLLAAITAVLGPRRLLIAYAAMVAVVLVPIMGLQFGGPREPRPGAPRLRLLSFNAASGARSPAAMAAEIQAIAPDVVVLQESNAEVNAVIAAALPGFAVRASTQFFIASRFPILELDEPAKLTFEGSQRSPRFVRFTLDSPLGKLDLYDVHPISPRDALDDLRALAGVPHRPKGLRSGTKANAAMRRLQVQTFAALAAASANPVILAGDTNLPASSPMFTELLGGWQDGFAAVGRGFGYTFPVGRHGAWMRIDRILASDHLRFLSFHVGEGRGSDHYAVWAELELATEPR